MIPNINLLPQQKKVSKNKTGKLIAFLLTVCALLFFGINYYLVRTDINEATQQSDKLAAQIYNYKQQLKKLDGSEKGALTSSVNYAESVAYPLTPIIENLQKNLNNTGELVGISYSADGLKVTVDFDTLAQSSAYVKKLSKDKQYNDVKIESVSAFTPITIDSLDEEEVDLEVASRYKAILQLEINRDVATQTEGDQ